MRMTKGKWVASYRDTYNDTMDKINLAFVSKVYEVLKRSEHCSVPMYFVEQQASLQGVEDPFSNEVDIDAAHQIRMNALEELIWTFSSEEPDITKYNFSFEFGGSKGIKRIGSQEEYERYSADEDAYWIRKKAGYKLFGETYQYLFL